VLANYLIGLREGLEASLVVSILVAYLVKTDRADRLRAVWLGVLAAISLSLAFGALLTFTSHSMSFEAQEMFGGVMSILAVAMVTWMVFWMKRTARFLKRDLEGRLESALSMGTAALVTIAFVSVAREGIETSLFIWSASQATSGTRPLIGALLGLSTAATLGYLLYKSAVHINLARFFKYTGLGLVVVAAGVLAYGFHDLQEAGSLPGLNDTVFDISGAVPLTSWYGSLLKGAFNFNPAPTYVELSVWVVYLVTVMTAFLWPVRSRPVVTTQAPKQSANI
jgi:high-affinity iron transporter